MPRTGREISRTNAIVPVVLGHHLLVARIGYPDRVATCYLAREVTAAPDGPEVVIRILHEHLAEDPRHVEEFQSEGQEGLQQGEMAPIRVFEVGQVDGRPFWVLERDAAMSRALVPEPKPEYRPLARWLPGPASGEKAPT
ncbi:MAG: hypothetical protein ACOYOB_21245 [Myxococcota bacterium]